MCWSREQLRIFCTFVWLMHDFWLISYRDTVLRDAHKSMYVSECILYHTGTHGLSLGIFFIKLVFWGHSVKICSCKRTQRTLWSSASFLWQFYWRSWLKSLSFLSSPLLLKTNQGKKKKKNQGLYRGNCSLLYGVTLWLHFCKMFPFHPIPSRNKQKPPVNQVKGSKGNWSAQSPLPSAILSKLAPQCILESRADSFPMVAGGSSAQKSRENSNME